MPAIDPTRLSRQLDALQSGSNDPNEIAAEVIGLLEEYSETTKPPAPAVPKPVMRSLRSTLHQTGQSEEISKVLWKNGTTDSRLLAARLLEAVEQPGVAAIAERWAGQNVIIEIVRELGERGLSGWRRVDPIGFIDQVRSWLDQDKRRIQVLAIYSLKGRVGDPDFEDLPSVFGLIEGRVGGSRGELREAMVTLITALGKLVPEETVNFLVEQKPSPLIQALMLRIDKKRVGVV